eukprot:GHVR01111794.1.p1 GENE.GHVR01111794.1~~GHVR01111794.1.p1  ORF type:complete len:107 (+),score=42.44 GHVR01111794.1:304-624(+)
MDLSSQRDGSERRVCVWVWGGGGGEGATNPSGGPTSPSGKKREKNIATGGGGYVRLYKTTIAQAWGNEWRGGIREREGEDRNLHVEAGQVEPHGPDAESHAPPGLA